MSTAVEEERDAGGLGAWRELVHSAERQGLVDTVRRHLVSRFPLEVVRRCHETGRQPDDAWSEMAEADYASIGLPEELGGLGSMVDVVALLEAAGRELLPAPLLSTLLSLQTCLSAGATAVGDPGRPAALAVVEGDGPLVVLDGVLAERVTVVVAGPDGVHASHLDTSSTPPAASYVHVDASRPVAIWASRDAQGSGFELGTDLDSVLGPARTALAADLTGAATGALDRAVRHAVDREQFGKPIGAFQGVKHRLADVYVGIERARSLTRAAAVALASGDAAAVELSLLAKGAATEAAVEATRAHVQVLGAMGMTFEADAHLFFRRVQQTAPFLGSAAECFRRAAELRREGPR